MPMPSVVCTQSRSYGGPLTGPDHPNSAKTTGRGFVKLKALMEFRDMWEV